MSNDAIGTATPRAHPSLARQNRTHCLSWHDNATRPSRLLAGGCSFRRTNNHQQKTTKYHAAAGETNTLSEHES